MQQKQILIQAPAEVVWMVLTDIEGWPAWQENVRSAKLKGPVAENTKFIWKAGGLTFHSRLHTVKARETFGWTGRILGVFAVHNWRLAVEGESTLVDVEESLEGFFPTLMKKSFQKQLSFGMEKNLLELKEESEKVQQESHKDRYE